MSSVEEKVIEEADGVIVCNKPPGLLTASSHLDEPGSLQYELMRHYRRMIWAVHQLDRDTSGVVLFVRRKKLVQTWTERLKAGEKTYLALCHGAVDFDSRLVEAPLGWIESLRRRGVCAGGQSAKTQFDVLERSQEATLLQVTLLTGRTHQVRLHLEHLGHPLVGEQRYNLSRPPAAARHMLHAWQIVAGERTWRVPMPVDMAEAIHAQGLVAPWD